MNYFKKTNFIILLLIYSFKVLSYENSILAIVENQVITLNDFKKFNKKSATENDIHALINQLVLELEIKSKNIQLAREQSSQAIINLAKTNNLTIDQLLSIKGIEKTIELVKLEISKKILKDSVIKSAKIQLSDAEVFNEMSKNPERIFFEEINVNQIKFDSIVNSEDNTINSNEEQSEYLLELVTKLKSKNKSLEHIKEVLNSKTKFHSQILWINNRDTPQKLFSTLNEVDIGNISKPIRINNSWHIFEILSKNSKDITSTLIKNRLIEIKEQQYYLDWLERTKNKYFIKIFNKKLDGFKS